jgi:O-6-methylguanine DNA methyltransferase
MDTEKKWIIVRIDGRIAAISTDYRQLASISARLAKDTKARYGSVTATAAEFEEIWKLRQEASWDDLLLFGTDFQKKVWKMLFDLTHDQEGNPLTPKMICYSDFAELCQNKAGVRAVAHAIGLNPVAVVIPCHLVVPKETIDKIREIQKKAESTIFKGDDLCINSLLREKGIDFGEYALGRKIKRELIQLEHSQQA